MCCLLMEFIVLATAKIHILKQFTTIQELLVSVRKLCLLLQRYTFWSNSQRGKGRILSPPIVLATAKIHILKQFTTQGSRQPSGIRLCLLLQRYTFWSNSQPTSMTTHPMRHCACYCKDTHFEAIHNSHNNLKYINEIVLATAKIHILKQFTTTVHAASLVFHCACYCKDTHFEAIHNTETSLDISVKIVLATAKIHILKQFTTVKLIERYSNHCACYCKDTHFEAIHNWKRLVWMLMSIVLATAKIHILKQFTTFPRVDDILLQLCLLLQRYTFWSNSQQ